jgi:hypothetical protein
MDTRADSDHGLLHLRLTVSVAGLPQLSRLLQRLAQLKGVHRAVRKI